MEREIAGPLMEISAYTMKHPPVQFPDEVAKELLEKFILGEPCESNIPLRSQIVAAK
jgi:myo-inositol-1-phosphate synthase